jgi:hypothetical protein
MEEGDSLPEDILEIKDIRDLLVSIEGKMNEDLLFITLKSLLPCSENIVESLRH